MSIQSTTGSVSNYFALFRATNGLTNPTQTNNTSSTTASNSSNSSAATYTLAQAQSYAAALLSANQTISSLIQNAQAGGTLNTSALEDAQSEQAINYQLLQNAVTGLYAQLSPSQLQSFEAALSSTLPLLFQAQQTASDVTQDIQNVNNILNQISSLNYSNTPANTTAPASPNSLISLQNALNIALAKQSSDSSLLQTQINALLQSSNPTASIDPQQQPNNPISSVYQQYVNNLSANVLTNLGLTTPPVTNPAWVTINQTTGVISTLNNPQALYNALEQELNSYFPNYDSSNNSFTLSQSNVLYPPQSSSGGIVGSTWSTVQAYAIQTGLMNQIGATSTAPTSLPSFIQKVPNSNPPSYVVTLDPASLNSMIAATAPYQNQTTPLTTDQTSTWLTSFKSSLNTITSTQANALQLVSPYQLQQLLDVYYASTKTLTSVGYTSSNGITLTDFSAASTNAYNKVYSTYSNDFTNEILDYLGLTPQPATQADDPNWGSWVTPTGTSITTSGSTLSSTGLTGLQNALSQLQSTFFPNYNANTGSFTPKAGTVLYPSTGSGTTWQNIVANWPQVEAANSSLPQNYTLPNTPPSPLPPFIQAVPNTNPTTYVIVQPSNILYPVQTTGATTITGASWQNVQAFAVQSAMMSATNATTTAPATLPSYIQAVAGSNPPTYIVTIDPAPLASIIQATNNLAQNPTSNLTASSANFQSWLKIFNAMQNTIILTGTGLQYPYIPNSLPNAESSQTTQSIMGLMSGMIHNLQTSYLQPQQTAATQYTAFFSAFNSQVYNQLANDVKASSTTSNTGASYINFNCSSFEASLVKFAQAYFTLTPAQSSTNVTNNQPITNAVPNSTSAILYPPQNSSTISPVLPNGSTLTLAEAKAWAQNFGYSQDQINGATNPLQLPCIVQVTDNGITGYVVIADPQPVVNMLNSLQTLVSQNSSGDMLVQTYQAWNDGFESNLSTMKNQLQTFAQSYQTAVSLYQSDIDLFSSLISALYKALQQIISNWT